MVKPTGSKPVDFIPESHGDGETRSKKKNTAAVRKGDAATSHVADKRFRTASTDALSTPPSPKRAEMDTCDSHFAKKAFKKAQETETNPLVPDEEGEEEITHGGDLYIVADQSLVVKPGSLAVPKAKLALQIVHLLGGEYLEIPQFSEAAVHCVTLEDLEKDGESLEGKLFGRPGGERVKVEGKPKPVRVTTANNGVKTARIDGRPYYVYKDEAAVRLVPITKREALVQQFEQSHLQKVDFERNRNVEEFFDKVPLRARLDMLAYCLVTAPADAKLTDLGECNFLFVLDEKNNHIRTIFAIDYDDLFGSNPDLNWEFSLKDQLPVNGIRCSIPSLRGMRDPLSPEDAKYLMSQLSKVFHRENTPRVEEALAFLDKADKGSRVREKKLKQIRKTWLSASGRHAKTLSQILQHYPVFAKWLKTDAALVNSRIDTFRTLGDRFVQFKNGVLNKETRQARGKTMELVAGYRPFAPYDLLAAMYPLWAEEFDKAEGESDRNLASLAGNIGAQHIGFRRL